MKHRLWWHALAFFVLLPATAFAQERPWMSSGLWAPIRYRSPTAVFLAPSLGFGTPLGPVRARVDLAELTGGLAHLGGGVDASLAVPGLTSLRLWPSIYRYDGGQVVPDGREAGTRSGLGVALELGEAGLWFARESDARDARALGRSAFRLGGGAWIGAGRASLSLSVWATQFADTLPVAHSDVFRFLDAYTFDRLRWEEKKIGFRYTDAEGELAYSVGPVRLAVGGGFRGRTRGVDGGRWARLNGTVDLPRNLVLEVTGGVRGGRPEHYLDRGKFIAMGFSWRYGASAGRPRRAPSQDPKGSDDATVSVEVLPAFGKEGARLVRFLGIEGARVELAGTLTDWEPVELTSNGDGSWSLVRYVPPGDYRILVRVDGGAWRAPPGLPALADEFGARVGLLLIR